MTTISVVIPALNAAKTLSSTLLALKNNTIEPDEIIVVDGLSNDRTGDIAKQFGCRVVENDAIHTAAARQIGLVSSNNRIVAMTDADCVPSQDWLERIYNHFNRDPKLDGVGGPLTLEHALTRVEAYCARKARIGTPEQLYPITQKEMRGRFSGANCAYRRSTLKAIGGFNLGFKAYGEDIDLFWRLVENNSRLLFDPSLIVEHLGFSKDLFTLACKSVGYGIASARLARSHFPNRRFDTKFYWRPWVNIVKELLRYDQKKYPECIFLDDISFALGRTWELIKGREKNNI